MNMKENEMSGPRPAPMLLDETVRLSLIFTQGADNSGFLRVYLHVYQVHPVYQCGY